MILAGCSCLENRKDGFKVSLPDFRTRFHFFSIPSLQNLEQHGRKRIRGRLDLFLPRMFIRKFGLLNSLLSCAAEIFEFRRRDRDGVRCGCH